MSAPCVATKADASPCNQPAIYACNGGHVLCTNHAKRLGGHTRRRKTDRRCSVCQSLRILCLVEDPPANDRRAEPADPASVDANKNLITTS